MFAATATATPQSSTTTTTRHPKPQVPATARQTTIKWVGQLVVTDIIVETPEVKTIRLGAIGGGNLPFTFIPGQFVTLTWNREGEKSVKRAYTISSSPMRREHIDLTVKREEFGLMSRYLCDDVRIGQELHVSGAAGHFVFSGVEHPSVVMVAGGVGVTPFLSEIRYLIETGWPGEIYLLYSCRVPSEYIFGAELEAMRGQDPNLHIFTTMTRAAEGEWNGLRGRITREFIEEHIPHYRDHQYHICGPDQMIESSKEMIAELGVPKEQIKAESFGSPKKPAA